MIVDAHQHFWRLDRGDYAWLTPELAPLYRNFQPEDLQDTLSRLGIGATIIVQAAPTEAETRHCIDIAKRWPLAKGVVGWVDFEAEDMPQALSQLVDYGGGMLKGVRPMIQDIPDADWVASPSLDRAFDAVIAHDLVFEALVRPTQLPALERRLVRHPQIRCVVDHGAKPPIASRRFEDWSRAMARLADHDAIVGVKLSGLLTEAAPGDGIDAIRPWFEHMLQRFGANRLVWGSDWPVLTCAASYDAWFEMAHDLCAGAGAAGQASIFGGNAARIYRLETLA